MDDQAYLNEEWRLWNLFSVKLDVEPESSGSVRNEISVELLGGRRGHVAAHLAAVDNNNGLAKTCASSVN